MVTIGLDFVKTDYTAKDGKKVSVKIWDTAGQERFKNITKSFYKNADGIIVAYDVSAKHTYENVQTWV